MNQISHQLTSNVKLLQKAAIIRRHPQTMLPEVLLLKRSSDALSRPNCWDLPGGNSEWPVADQGSAANLHLADLTREISEETGLQISSMSLSLNQLTHLSTFFDTNKQVFTIIVGWVVDFVRTAQNGIQISSEHQDFIWVQSSELEQYDFGGDSGAFVVDIVRQSFAKFL